MRGRLTEGQLEGRPYACFVPDSLEHERPLAVLCGWDMADKLPDLAENLPAALLFWTEADGAREFTPWPEPGVWAGEDFTGQAAEYLSFLTGTALPWLEETFGASSDPNRRVLLGYSLGGLFALWAMCRNAPFGAYASLSGSLWYEEFLECLGSAPLEGTERVYLSLGDREEFGGPPRMRAVGDCTRRAFRELSARLEDVTLEWNKGGHGKGVQNRWKRALGWWAERIAGGRERKEERI